MSQILLIHLVRCSVFLTVATLLFMLLIRVSRLKSVAIHRAIWGGVLLVSLFGFAIPITIPVVQVAETLAQPSPEPLPVTSVESLPMQQYTSFTPQINTTNVIVAVPDTPPIPPQISEPPAYVVVQAWLTLHWQTLVLTVWGLGVVALFAWRLISHAMLSVRLFRQIKPIDDTNREHWETLLLRHGFRRTAVPIRLTESTGPAIIRSGFGFVLLIPETVWDELSPEVRGGVLRHELGHLVHRDTLLSPTAYVLAALQWFNPAAWYALKRYNKATEWHADEFAYGTQQGGSSLLAETFLAIHLSTESQGLSLQSFAQFSTLDRIDRLTTLEESEKEHIMKKIIVGAVALTLLLAGTFRVEFVAHAETEKIETTERKAEAVEVNLTTPEPEENNSPLVANQEDFRITGRVFMPDGSPAKNVKVVGTGAVNSNTSYGFSTTTDMNGYYSIRGFHLMMAQCDAFAFQAYLSHYPELTPTETLDEQTRYRSREIFEPLVSEIKSFSRDGMNENKCDFTLEEGFPIQGIVYDADGTPAKGEIVSFVPTQSPDALKDTSVSFSRGALTDAEGKYQIYLSPGEYRVSALRGQDNELAEVGAGKNPEIDLVLKNITLVRLVHEDGTPLFQEKVTRVVNFSYWEIGELDAHGNPSWGSVSVGADFNDNGDIKLISPQRQPYIGNIGINLINRSPKEKSYIIYMSNDFQEGFVGEIPTGLENFAVYTAQLAPTVKARFRILDTLGKPLIQQDVSCFVDVKHVLCGESSTGLSVGNVIRTDDAGYITIHVPALGDFADRFRYQLNVEHPKNLNIKARYEPEFRPPQPGSEIDAGVVILDADFSAFEPAE